MKNKKTYPAQKNTMKAEELQSTEKEGLLKRYWRGITASLLVILELYVLSLAAIQIFFFVIVLLVIALIYWKSILRWLSRLNVKVEE